MNLMATVKKVAKKAAKKVAPEAITLVKGSSEWLEAKEEARKKLDLL
jgi:hypothetical protein